MQSILYEEKKVTIKDVAELANVSVATVGRVIGNYGSVSSKTKLKVMNAVKKLNYVPNNIAQDMRKQTTQTIAVIVPNVKNSFFGTILEIIEKKSRKRGFNVLICNTHEEKKLELEYIEMVCAKRVAGIVMASCFNDVKDIPIKDLIYYGHTVPLVLFDRKIIGLNLDVIESDNYDGAFRATEYLISLGHKNIAAIGSVKEIITTTVAERINGYRDALASNNIVYNSNIVKYVDWEKPEEIKKKMKKLMDQEEASAILILNNSICGNVLMEYKKRSLEFPEDFSIISWDDEEYSRLLEITTVDQDVARIGNFIIDRLFSLIDNPDKKNDGSQARITLKTKMVVRNSCREF